LREAILYIGLSQGLFAAFVIFTKRKKHASDRLLIAWLLLICLKFLILLLYDEYGEFFDVGFSNGFIPLSFGPFLYLYTKYITDEDARFGFREILHAAPFVILTAFYFAFFQERVDFSDHMYLVPDEYIGVRILYASVYFISIFTYTALTYRQLYHYRKNMVNRFSFESGKNQLKWLYFTAGLITATFTFYFIVGLVNAINKKPIIDSELMANLGLTVMTFSVSYFGIKQEALFRDPQVYLQSEKAEQKEELDVNLSPRAEKKAEFKEENSPEEEKEKYKRSGLKEKDAEIYIERLLAFMEREKPYLDEDLTILDLSAKLNISKHHLTQILNNHLGKNFFTFVNEYRVEEVKRKLADEAFDHLTIMGIAYDCGFNSKSSFNNIFKQYTGLTPSEYKKQVVKIREAES
jgi:AraC-like DNA-binding protein